MIKTKSMVAKMKVNPHQLRICADRSNTSHTPSKVPLWILDEPDWIVFKHL